MKIETQVLENRFVRLEPLDEQHREGLRIACDADQDVWEKLYPFSWAGEYFEPTWKRMQREAEAGRMHLYAVLAQGRCVGITCYIAPDAINASVEVGGTYYAPQFRGGAVNPAAKQLMMTHAFAAGARRLVYRVDAINARSRAAVLKLGAVQEGILRSERITWTGRVRDTVVFSILAEEWPGVRERLDARLAALG